MTSLNSLHDMRLRRKKNIVLTNRLREVKYSSHTILKKKKILLFSVKQIKEISHTIYFYVKFI